MSERYSKLFSLPENLYTEGSPVIIAAGALLKDNQTGRVIAQLKLRNISSKTIKAATVSLLPLNTVGKPLGEAVRYEYLDLNSTRDTDFGSKSAILMPDITTRSFSTMVAEIIFADNSVWNANDATWETLKNPETLTSRLDSEMVKQFRIEYGSGAKNFFLEQEDLWYCVCGAVNRREEKACHSCRKATCDLRDIDLDVLKEHKEQRLIREREQAEKEATEAKIKEAEVRKKIGKIAAVIVPALAFIIVAAVIISGMVKKANAYKDALTLMNNEQYEEAITAFTALDGYKDSAEQIQSAKNSIADMERATEYDRAIQLLESGKSENENEAYYLLMELGDYQDAKNLLTHFTYVCIASDNTRYEYDSSGNLVEKDYGSSSHLYEYENGHVVWEGQSKGDWSAKTYTYYPNGILKSKSGAVTYTQSGVVTNETVYYNERGWPEAAIYTKDDEPDVHKTWNFTYTFSDDGLITELFYSFQDYGETQVITQAVDFTEHGGFLSDIQFSSLNDSAILSITNANKTRTEVYTLARGSSYMRKNSEVSFVYDSNGKIISKTTCYPQSNQEITEHYSYDDGGNLIEERSNANENTDNRLYLTTYTYGYIYTPDVQ